MWWKWGSLSVSAARRTSTGSLVACGPMEGASGVTRWAAYTLRLAVLLLPTSSSARHYSDIPRPRQCLNRLVADNRAANSSTMFHVSSLAWLAIVDSLLSAMCAFMCGGFQCVEQCLVACVGHVGVCSVDSF